MAQYFYATVARMVASVYKQAEIKAAPSSLVFAKDNIFYVLKVYKSYQDYETT